MSLMVVTLEVSKLSGWLKADAACRVEGRAGDAGGRGMEPGAGRACGVVAAHKRHALGCPDSRLGAKGARRAHAEHVAHVRDAEGVEAQRLVEGRRVLPSRREGMRCRGERCEPGGERAWGGGGTQAACTGMSRLKACGGQGHARRAHQEHGLHGRDAGGVEAQRLVEDRRALPSRREGMRCGAAGRGGSREAGGPVVWWRHDKRHARGWPDVRPGGQGHARSARRTCRSWS
jgi:hypothetical protein